jgi:hypothetical protein
MLQYIRRQRKYQNKTYTTPTTIINTITITNRRVSSTRALVPKIIAMPTTTNTKLITIIGA